MAQERASVIFIGIRGTVLGIDASNGTEIWRTRLSGSYFVNVAVDGEVVYASTHGEIYCLSAAGGAIRWKNSLKGLGMGLVTIGVPGQNAVAAAEMQMDSDRAASAATAAAVVAATS